MASHLFEGKNVMKTLKNSIKRCEVCQKNNPKTEKLAKSGLQRSGRYPGKDWEIDLTHMPKANGYSCLQVWVDTFTGWIEAFPCRSEQAKEVIKSLIHKIIPRFGLPLSLQSDNGSAFKAAVTQGMSKALGIECHLHCSCKPQSSGKVEKANDIIKRHMHKLTQKTQGNWIKVLPIALMRSRTAPKKEGLSTFECIYGRPFLCTDIVIELEGLELINYVTQLSAFQQTLTELQEMTPDPASESSKPLFEPETEVLIKTLGSGGPSLEPLWEGRPLPGYSFFSHSCESARN